MKVAVALNLDSRLNPKDIIIEDPYVPIRYKEKISSSKFLLRLKITCESDDGKVHDLTMSRCDTCQDRMLEKNKDEPNSPRFCDVLSNKIIQTRRRGKVLLVTVMSVIKLL